jgi:hypothetical protein
LYDWIVSPRLVFGCIFDVWLSAAWVVPSAVPEPNDLCDQELLSCIRGSIVSPICGRYRRTTSEQEIARQYHIPIPPQLDLPISYNVAPTENVLAIRRNPKTDERTLDAQ